MAATIIDPSIHVVRDTPVARVFRRALKFDDVLTFFHVKTGQWVLAYWIKKSHRMVDEIEDLGTNFELVTPELIRQISQCWGRIDWRAKVRRMASQHRDKERERTDRILEDQDRWDWTKDRTAEKAPVPYAFGLPVSSGGGQSELVQ